MSRTLVGLAALLSAVAALAQPARVPNSLVTLATVRDAAGNEYSTGSFVGTVTLGSTLLVSPDPFQQQATDVFVAKRDAAGHYLWSRQAGGTGDDKGLGIAVDSGGGVCVTGQCGGNLYYCIPGCFTPADVPRDVWSARKVQQERACQSLDTAIFRFGSFKQPYRGSSKAGAGSGDNLGDNLFVARLSPTGEWQALHTVQSTGMIGVIGTAVTLDQAGNAYVTGLFAGTARFGAHEIKSRRRVYSNAFAACLTPAGTWQWAASGGSSSTTAGTAIAVNDSGAVFVAGDYQSTTPATSLGAPTCRFGSYRLTGSDNPGLFVACLDPAGRWQWATGNRAGAATAESLTLAPNGGVYVTGRLAGPRSRSRVTRFNSFSLFDNGTNTRFQSSLSKHGEWLTMESAYQLRTP